MARGFKTGGRVMKQKKECGICLIVKPREEFYLRRGRIHSANCKSCEQARRQENPNPNRFAQKHDYWLRINYNLTLDDYYRILKQQDGRCAVCGAYSNSRGRRWFDVDHNHKTGQVRGLLCSDCNHGMGAMKDDIRLLRRAIAYLERYV